MQNIKGNIVQFEQSKKIWEGLSFEYINALTLNTHSWVLSVSLSHALPVNKLPLLHPH